MDVSRWILRKAAALADDGISFALCTVIVAKGSVPGKAGAKMIVLADGSQFGTVGGAGLEEKTKALAVRCLSERRSRVERFDLAYYRPGALDSLCGGAVEILIEYMGAPPHILICGGGHVGLEVARLCDQLDYLHSVLDDRAEFASAQRFPNARHCFAQAPQAFFDAPGIPLQQFSHLLILGYSHRIDTEILFHAVSRFPGYIGLICSRLKRKEMFGRLQERGISAADLTRVHAPLGIPIGGESPAEIAVSILGGIIAHHKGALPLSLDETRQPREPENDHGPDAANENSSS